MHHLQLLNTSSPRVAHNEGILENVTSLGGLGLILGQIVQCKIFLKFEKFLGVPTGLPNIPDPLYTRTGIFTKVIVSV